ncbi:MAG: hypothetical protein WCY30_02320 [Candidatus Neomarinimicrobiota bacterium]|jgi:hypothetical protein
MNNKPISIQNDNPEYIKDFIEGDLPSKPPAMQERLLVKLLFKKYSGHEINIKPIPVKLERGSLSSILFDHIVSKDMDNPALRGCYIDSRYKLWVATDAYKLVAIHDPDIVGESRIVSRNGDIIRYNYPDYRGILPLYSNETRFNLLDALYIANGVNHAYKFMADSNCPIEVKIRIGDYTSYFSAKLVLSVFMVFARLNIMDVTISVPEGDRANRQMAMIFDSNNNKNFAVMMPVNVEDECILFRTLIDIDKKGQRSKMGIKQFSSLIVNANDQ